MLLAVDAPASCTMQQYLGRNDWALDGGSLVRLDFLVAVIIKGPSLGGQYGRMYLPLWTVLECI